MRPVVAGGKSGRRLHWSPPLQNPQRWASHGYLKIKSKRLPGAEMRPPRDAQDDTKLFLSSLRNFVANPGSVSVNIPLVCKTAPINFTDPLLELLPEVYIESTPISKQEIEKAADDLARETASFLIRFRKETIVEALRATN